MNDFDRSLDPALGQSLTSAAIDPAEAPCGPEYAQESMTLAENLASCSCYCLFLSSQIFGSHSSTLLPAASITEANLPCRAAS